MLRKHQEGRIYEKFNSSRRLWNFIQKWWHQKGNGGSEKLPEVAVRKCDNFKYCGEYIWPKATTSGRDDPKITCCSPGCAQAVYSRFLRGKKDYIRTE